MQKFDCIYFGQEKLLIVEFDTFNVKKERIFLILLVSPHFFWGGVLPLTPPDLPRDPALSTKYRDFCGWDFSWFFSFVIVNTSQAFFNRFSPQRHVSQ